MQVAATHNFYDFAPGTTGTIGWWVLHGPAEPGRGPVLTYQVVFDEPQYDYDGDGPYPFATLPASELRRSRPRRASPRVAHAARSWRLWR